MGKALVTSKYFEYLEEHGKLPKLDQNGDWEDKISDSLFDDEEDFEEPDTGFIGNTDKSNDSSFAQALMKSR